MKASPQYLVEWGRVYHRIFTGAQAMNEAEAFARHKRDDERCDFVHEYEFDAASGTLTTRDRIDRGHGVLL